MSLRDAQKPAFESNTENCNTKQVNYQPLIYSLCQINSESKSDYNSDFALPDALYAMIWT